MWLLVFAWIFIFIVCIIHFIHERYKKYKRKKIKQQENINKMKKETKKMIQETKECIEEMKQQEMDLLDLIIGYKDNDISFNYVSLTNYLSQENITYSVSISFDPRFLLTIIICTYTNKNNIILHLSAGDHPGEMRISEAFLQKNSYTKE